MSKKRKVIIVGIVNIALLMLLVMSFTIGTPTRAKVVVYEGEHGRVLKENAAFAFEFDTGEYGIVGIEMNCEQYGKPLNEGGLTYQLYDSNDECVGEYAVSLINVDTSSDYLTLNFDREIKGVYTLKAQLQNINPWDSMGFGWIYDSDDHTIINDRKYKGAFEYNFIIMTDTYPYIFDVVLLMIFSNLLVFLYIGKEDGKEKSKNDR